MHHMVMSFPPLPIFPSPNPFKSLLSFFDVGTDLRYHVCVLVFFTAEQVKTNSDQQDSLSQIAVSSEAGHSIITCTL